MRKKAVIVFSLIAFLAFHASCKKDLMRTNAGNDVMEPRDLVSVLNDYCVNLQKMTACYLNGEELLAFEDLGRRADAYSICFTSGARVRFPKMTPFVDSICPFVSMLQDDSVFYWMVNGELLKNNSGDPYRVDDVENVPVLSCEEGGWSCRIGGDTWDKFDAVRVHPVAFENEIGKGIVVVAVSPECKIVFYYSNFIANMGKVIPNRAYYKDVFLDAGIGLTSRKNLAAVSFLGMTLECMSFSSDDDYELQNQLIEGDSTDLNGRLLYPDGQPRYRLLFVNGGGANTHGQSLTEESRNHMRQFHRNGGSYVGTCAGSSFASKGFNGPNLNPNYLQIWPEFVKRTNLLHSYTGFFIEPNCPLLDYYDMGGDLYMDSVRHNNGNYPSSIPPGGEVLARYDRPDLDSIHLKPSAWAYKESDNTGRIIQIGSHPEEIWYGEQREFTAASILYAIAGRGKTEVKGFLQNGIKREMVKSSLDDDPAFTMIGDLQCHHFVFWVPQNVVDARVTLQSDSDADLSLMLNRSAFAYEEDAQYVSTGNGANHSFAFSNMKAGFWYVAVKCNTTVSIVETDWGQEYTGRTDVLNGVPYSIKVLWKTQAADASYNEETQ